MLLNKRQISSLNKLITKEMGFDCVVWLQKPLTKDNAYSYLMVRAVDCGVERFYEVSTRCYDKRTTPKINYITEQSFKYFVENYK